MPECVRGGPVMKRGDWVILVSVLGVGVAIGVGQAGIRDEIQSLREEHREDMQQVEETVATLSERISAEIRAISTETRAMRERLARIEQALSPEPAKIAPASEDED